MQRQYAYAASPRLELRQDTNSAAQTASNLTDASADAVTPISEGTEFSLSESLDLSQPRVQEAEVSNTVDVHYGVTESDTSQGLSLSSTPVAVHGASASTGTTVRQNELLTTRPEIPQGRESLRIDTRRSSPDSFLKTANWKQPDLAFVTAAKSSAQETARDKTAAGSGAGFPSLEVYIPEWHQCEDGDQCQESIERDELIQHIFAHTGQTIERSFCGNISYTQTANGGSLFKKEPLKADEQPASPLSPCSVRTSELLKGLGRREPREGVSAYLKNVIPVSALPQVLPPGFEIPMITPPRPGLSRQNSRQQSPPLPASISPVSAPKLQRFNSQPELHRARSSLDVRPSPSRFNTTSMMPLRASLDSVRVPSENRSLPASRPRRASQALATVSEDHQAVAERDKLLSSAKKSTQSAMSSTMYRPSIVSGWLRYRKKKLLGTEWKRLYYVFNDTLLHLYSDMADAQPSKTLNLLDYYTTQDGKAARKAVSRVGALMKKLRLSAGNEEQLVPKGWTGSVELIPEPERVSAGTSDAPKVHVFLLKDDAEGSIFVRNVMRRKLEWHAEQGHRPLLNGQEFRVTS